MIGPSGRDDRVEQPVERRAVQHVAHHERLHGAR
jgi:hypothetical protein